MIELLQKPAGLLVLYLAAINLLTLLAFGLDKRKAVRQRWRIPERTLFVLAAVGGSLGALGGMFLFHHKTRKPAFRFGIPAILAVQLGLWLFIIMYQ